MVKKSAPRSSAPEPLGFAEDAPADLNSEQLKVWSRQHAYLNALAKLGTTSHAAQAAGVVKETVRLWRVNDVHGFKAREREAIEVLADNVEYPVFQNVMGEGADRIWTLATLKALRREKWGDQVNLHDDRAIEILDRLIALPKGPTTALPSGQPSYIDAVTSEVE